MADSKKYDGSQWEHSLRKLTTATAAVENPLYSDGTAITAYTLKGKNGTPTPSNPVAVNGVGVRTENLLSLADVSTQTINGIEFSIDAQKGTVKLNGTATLDQNTEINLPINPLLNGDYFVSGCPDGGSNSTYDLYVWDYATSARVKQWDGVTAMVSVRNANESSEIQLIQGHNTQVRIRARYGVQFDNLEFKPMIRIPTAPSAFEPYGYKIPISNGQQTIDIYIGDLPLLKSLDGTAVDEISNGILTRRVDSDGSVLPTPTTTQITMPPIPTTEGANSITVDTTAQPSEFTATWTGWHNSSVKEWDGSQWNE